MNIKNLLPIFLLAFGVACAKPNPSSKPPTPLVIVSISPYQHLVEKIGGDLISVRTIIPPSMDVHHFEPTPRQVTEFANAKIWFRIGEAFERPLVSRFQKQWKIVDLREGIDLIALEGDSSCSHSDSSRQDRHIWMSPKRAKSQAQIMATALISYLPEHRDVFLKNLSDLEEELDVLDREIEEALSRIPHQSFLTSHPSFGYFCKDYGLSQLSIEYEGKEPGPKHLNTLLETANKCHPSLVITLPQHNNKGAYLLAKELSLRVEMIDPYALDYFHTLRQLTRALVPPDSP